jgi:hypothetical protein
MANNWDVGGVSAAFQNQQNPVAAEEDDVNVVAQRAKFRTFFRSFLVDEQYVYREQLKENYQQGVRILPGASATPIALRRAPDLYLTGTARPWRRLLCAGVPRLGRPGGSREVRSQPPPAAAGTRAHAPQRRHRSRVPDPARAERRPCPFRSGRSR